MFVRILSSISGMQVTDKNFYIISEDILPEPIYKTLLVKEIMVKGEAKTVNEAVKIIGISRSVYYKYRDGIFGFYEATEKRIVTLSLLLDHQSGVLSNILNMVAKYGGNILTINQGIPLQGVANASISMETMELSINLLELINRVNEISGVRKIEMICKD